MSRLPQLVRALLPGTILLFSTAAWAAPFGATYSVGPIAPFAEGEVRVISVTVTNTGTKAWTYETCKDQTFFGLAYHWDGPVGIFDGQRSYIPKTVKPGESITLPVPVEAPPLAGSYTLRFDMVEDQAGGGWFSQQTEPVPTQNVPLTVNAKPAAGKITGVAFDYQTAAPGLKSFKVIPVGNDCPYEVDFGDLSPTKTNQDEQGSAGVFHTYAATGTVTVTAKAKAPCTGTSSRSLSVVSIASLCQLIPLLLDLNANGSIVFTPLFLPRIDLVDPGQDASWLLVIFGQFFRTQRGTVEVEGNFGNLGKSLSLEIAEWEPEVLLARWPANLLGAPDQTIRLRVVTHDGLATDWREVPFKGRRHAELIPASLAVGNCENDTACTQCGNHSDDDCFFPGPQGTISASHISTPVMCALGGGSGKDTWTFTLKNGWTFLKADVGPTYTFGSSFTPCSPAVGSTSFTCTIPWDVEGCEELFYSMNLFAFGPAGVPMS